MPIDKVAFFGDSYCFDTVTKKKSHGTATPFYPPTPSYMDMFAEKHNLQIVHVGTPAHGPNWMIHEFREWLASKSQEYINETHFVFCWSDEGREIVRNTGDLTERTSFEDEMHPGEMSLPGPDTPMLKDEERFDRRVRQAIELYWIYLKPTLGEAQRQFTTVKDAWTLYIKRHNISSYQQYHCFDQTAIYENNCHSFEYMGKTFSCLQHFAFSMEDYVQGENRDLPPEQQDHYNHFSPQGQKRMAEVLERRFKECS